VIVILNGRSLLCSGLAARLALREWPVVSVPLAANLGQLAATLTRLEPQLLILDAADVLGTGFLFLDALREEPWLAGCPVLIVAGGTLPGADRFREAAARRGCHVLLDPVNFDYLAREVESLVAGAGRQLASVAD
jgi:hypothetical protein